MLTRNALYGLCLKLSGASFRYFLADNDLVALFTFSLCARTLDVFVYLLLYFLFELFGHGRGLRHVACPSWLPLLRGLQHHSVFRLPRLLIQLSLALSIFSHFIKISVRSIIRLWGRRENGNLWRGIREIVLIYYLVLHPF